MQLGPSGTVPKGSPPYRTHDRGLTASLRHQDFLSDQVWIASSHHNRKFFHLTDVCGLDHMTAASTSASSKHQRPHTATDRQHPPQQSRRQHGSHDAPSPCDVTRRQPWRFDPPVTPPSFGRAPHHPGFVTFNSKCRSDAPVSPKSDRQRESLQHVSPRVFAAHCVSPERRKLIERMARYNERLANDKVITYLTKQNAELKSVLLEARGGSCSKNDQ